ncbi:MAG: hypothetical protein K2F87_01215 [Muribaculaceae bacterium]|nr:hypothetical protein [Muribaculaceae bacterium]
MTDKIAILITGNPDSSSGCANIGSVGVGLEKIDPVWPNMAGGDFALIVTETGQATRYCLIFNSALITASDSNRGGMLNFQLLIPFDEAILGPDGRFVSPFTFLYRLFERFKSLHLKSYPGVEGWNYIRNARMTDEEFADFLKDYRLVHFPQPARRLNGSGEATLVLPLDKLEQLALDHAYPQLTEFNKLVLCAEGTTSPALLARLEIPRIPEFEIFVNGQKMDVIFRRGDEPFRYTVLPQDTYKLPETIVVNLEEGENKKIDSVNERIDYRVSFKDKTEDRKVTVQLKGCESNPGLYDRLLKNILENIVLKNEATGLPCRRMSISVPAKTDTFTLKGAEIGSFWAPECASLPKNITLEECVPDSEKSWVMRFRYEKPVEKPLAAVTRQPDVEVKKKGDKRDDDAKQQAPAPQPVVKVPVYITGNDTADRKLTEACRALTFNMEIQGADNLPVLAYQGLMSDGRSEKKRFSSKETNKRDCFATDVHVPFIYIPYLQENGMKCIEAESNDKRYILKAQYGKLDDEPDGEWFIRVRVRRRGFGQRLLGAPWLKPVLIALVCLGFGWWIGESFTPWQKMTAKETPAQTVTDPVAGEDAPVDSLGGEDSTGGVVDPEQSDKDETATLQQDRTTTPPDVPGNNTVETVGDNALDKAAGAAAAAELKALNDKSAQYLDMIRKASMSFAQVDEIQRWVMANKSKSGKINNYSEIMKAIAVFANARNLVSQIKPGANFTALAPSINAFVKGISTDAPYKQLRSKMQKLNGNNVKSNIEVEEILYNFAEKHPNGITSFSQL